MVDSDMAKVASEGAAEKVRTNLEEYLEKGIVKQDIFRHSLSSQIEIITAYADSWRFSIVAFYQLLLLFTVYSTNTQ